MKACNQCGKCCIKYGNGQLSASEEDIKWWDLHKPHIYKYVHQGSIWVNPKNQAPLTECPWLQKQANNVYTCAIYFDRPEDCRYYPSSISEMISDGCEMLEPSDIKDLKRAQQKLNTIMADSHQ